MQRPPESLLTRTWVALLEGLNRCARSRPAVGRPATALLETQLPAAAAAASPRRVAWLVGSIRHRSVNEVYVQRYLERELGLDSFSLQVLLHGRKLVCCARQPGAASGKG